MKTESIFRGKITKELKDNNAKVISLVGLGGFKRDDKIYSQEAGLPDTIVIHTYIGVVFIEFKAVAGRLSDKQRFTIREINRRSINHAFICREVDGKQGTLENEAGIILGYFEGGKELINLISSIQRNV